MATETIWQDLSAVTKMLERLYAALRQADKAGENRSRLETEIESVLLHRAVLIERLGADTGEAA